MRITSVTPMKDEGPYILEWVAYHRLIGVNDMIVFSNDCRDGTSHILERLDEMGILRHLPNPSMFTGNTHHHWQVISYMNTFERLRRSDWVLSLDADEFLTVKTGQGRIEDLIEATGEPDVISFNQLNFGSSGRNRRAEGLQMRTYLQAQAYEGAHRQRIDRRGVKSLTRVGAKPKQFGNHSPIFDKWHKREVKWVNGGGESIEAIADGKQIKSLPNPHYSYGLAQLNHYAIRSAENFLVLRDRGNANHEDRAADLKYWLKYDVNQTENREILRHADDVEAQVAEWCQDAELGQLHAKAERYHRRWGNRLRKDPEFHALFMKCVRAYKRTWESEEPESAEAAA
ncbi:MAG: glycosyltransferase family 2 protein [Pseudomonadota bacterium]